MNEITLEMVWYLQGSLKYQMYLLFIPEMYVMPKKNPEYSQILREITSELNSIQQMSFQFNAI